MVRYPTYEGSYHFFQLFAVMSVKSRKVCVCSKYFLFESKSQSPSIIFFWRETGDFGYYSQWHMEYFDVDNVSYLCMEQCLQLVTLFGDNDPKGI